MNIYEKIAAKIIKEQELLMGPVAWYEAGKVKKISIIDRKEGIVSIEGNDGITVINDLVERYGSLFGRAGREVCKEAASALVADLQPSKVPEMLK